MKVEWQLDWLAAKAGDQLVMMSAQKGNYTGLSEVGTRVWGMIEIPKDFDVICETLLREFNVEPQVCRAEVKVFLKELVKHGAVALNPPVAA